MTAQLSSCTVKRYKKYVIIWRENTQYLFKCLVSPVGASSVCTEVVLAVQVTYFVELAFSYGICPLNFLAMMPFSLKIIGAYTTVDCWIAACHELSLIA